ncbi:hypothetical protein BDZ97DRAFT_302507 [Flammula alnicola]|nr:hypothetical protein BDZ97DRAFT_302507 [Flammula alnicola]
MSSSHTPFKFLMVFAVPALSSSSPPPTSTSLPYLAPEHLIISPRDFLYLVLFLSPALTNSNSSLSVTPRSSSFTFLLPRINLSFFIFFIQRNVPLLSCYMISRCSIHVFLIHAPPTHRRYHHHYTTPSLPLPSSCPTRPNAQLPSRTIHASPPAHYHYPTSMCCLPPSLSTIEIPIIQWQCPSVMRATSRA